MNYQEIESELIQELKSADAANMPVKLACIQYVRRHILALILNHKNQARRLAGILDEYRKKWGY